MSSALSASGAIAAVEETNPVMDWLGAQAGPFVSGLINVGIIVLVAFVARVVAGRVIAQLIKRIEHSHQRVNRGKGTSDRVVTETAAEHDGEVRERQAQRAQTIGAVLSSVATFVIFAVAFMMILSEFGIDLGPILASAGVLGLAIGFGAQGLVQDFLSGMFMMVEDQFGVGDVVNVGEAVGTVEAMSMRITKIRDLDGGLWYVRNGEIMRVCNMNQGWANAVVDVPLDYSVDLTSAKSIIESCMEEFASDPEFEAQILEAPDVNGVVGIGNGAVTMRVIIKTRPGEQWAIGRAARAQIKQRFDLEGIRVAHPLVPHPQA